ncbi:hypothetical protein HK405_011038 [Cladochytrium tenue]|nr:hypothetical protein HK405_011038 [Cladochytrium tenue]
MPQGTRAAIISVWAEFDNQNAYAYVKKSHEPGDVGVQAMKKCQGGKRSGTPAMTPLEEFKLRVIRVVRKQGTRFQTLDINGNVRQNGATQQDQGRMANV